MRIDVERFETDLLAEGEREVVRIHIVDDNGNEKGMIDVYEYNDGVIEVSQYQECGIDYLKGNNPFLDTLEKIENGRQN